MCIIGCGVVLREATCVAVEDVGEGEVYIKAYGDTARALSGKAALNTRIVNPVCEGDIVQTELTVKLLSYFFKKIEITPRKARQTEVLFVLPCSGGEELKDKYFAIAEELNIGRVYFTRTPYASVLGHNVELSKTVPVFSLDIGYGKTDIGIFSLDGMISGYTICLGGGNVDVHITDLLAESFSMRIGSNTAEKLKNVVGSLLEDDNKTLVVGGRGLPSGKPVQAAVNSYDLREVIALYVDKICEYVKVVLSDLPAEVASAVAEGGLYISGGFSKLDGLADYVSARLDVPVNVAEEPSLAAVIGACTLLSAPDLCARLVTED